MLGRRFDILILLGLTGVLLVAFVDQLLLRDLPCPLCLLQRMAFVAAGVGIALNLAVAPRASHYGVAILGALLGAAISARQVFLHIAPGTGSYGSAIFGLHFYTWALLCFAAVIAAAALAMLLFDRQLQSDSETPPEMRGARARLLVVAFAALALLNGLSTIAECKGGMCPDNPVSYLLFDRS